MAAQQHLPNAPITEAVIDFVVEPQAGASISELESAFADADFGYREVTPIWQSTFGFNLNAGQSGPTASPTPFVPQKLGLRTQASDAPYAATFRMNGFGLSRLTPYQDWERLESEARRLWAIYLQRFKVSKVTRVGTRFINNLNLPLRLGQPFEDYINKVVELPDELPQAVNSFVQQVEIADNISGNTVRLALAWDGRNSEAGRVPIILDIDVFRAAAFAPDNDEIWAALTSMRNLKNRCFFALLTEEAIKNYL